MSELLIGCGHKETWVKWLGMNQEKAWKDLTTLDINPNVGADIVHNLEEVPYPFPDNHFDVVVASYVLTTVPDPVKVIHELARVTKPGGAVLIVNHFSVENGLRGAIEKRLAKHASKLGWRPEFRYETLLASERLRLASIKAVKPLGFFTMLEFRKLD